MTKKFYPNDALLEVFKASESDTEAALEAMHEIDCRARGKQIVMPPCKRGILPHIMQAFDVKTTKTFNEFRETRTHLFEVLRKRRQEKRHAKKVAA